jgi:hypothetical protein
MIVVVTRINMRWIEMVVRLQHIPTEVPTGQT